MRRLASMPPPVRRMLLVMALLIAILLLGTIGFQLIERQNLFDSFYMTVITLTTVGYGEIFELSPYGRYFNVGLILTGVMVVFVSVGVMAETLLRAELTNYFEKRRTKHLIDKMSDHFIVCGLGRVGRGVIQQLQRAGARAVAIDKSEAHRAWARQNGVTLLTDDATLDDTLERAGAKRAKGLVVATNSDAENVYITLSARVLNPELTIVGRSYDEEASKKLLRAGAHTAFAAHSYTGYRLAHALLRPRASSFLEVASAIQGNETGIDIEEFHVTAENDYAGSTLDESGITSDFDLIILALAKRGHLPRFNPPSDTLLEPGDVLIVMGSRGTLDRMRVK